MGPRTAAPRAGNQTDRAAYGRDSLYSRMAMDSLVEWKALSALCDPPVFIPAGVLFFFPREESYFRETVAAHRELGLPTAVLSRADMARRFPMIDFEEIEFGLLEPEFGALMARRAVQILVDRFVRAGGTYLQGEAQPFADNSGPLREIRLSSGETVRADRFVFALGPWLPSFFRTSSDRDPGHPAGVFFFAPPAGDELPVGDDAGLGGLQPRRHVLRRSRPRRPRGQVRPRFARSGRRPRHPGPPPEQGRARRVVAFLDRRFPAEGAPLTEARVCQYENSSNGDFLIDFHPAFENVLLVGGGSGHGFKHGPEVGRYAAARLFGLNEPEPRFSLATKGESHQREVH